MWFAVHIAAPVIGWAAFVLSRFETGQMVLFHEPGDGASAPLGPRVAVFCHFDRHGRIRDHTRAYIDALRNEGFAVVFVTNSRELAAADRTWVRGRVAHLVVRRNVGYDFAAWRDAMSVCDLPSADTRFLLVANDSVYGPLRPLGPIFQRINFDLADIWGATDSWQHNFHLQSFFVAFGPRALRHEAFASFWSSVGNVRSKWWAVSRCELNMSRAFIAAGLRCKALWPYTGMIEILRQAAVQESAEKDEQVNTPAARIGSLSYLDPFADACRQNTVRVLNAALRHVPLNPTADLWQVLIEQGCPFIKRELLLDNPSQVPGVATWLSLIGETDDFSRDEILRDLEWSLKNRSP
jgi:Rhamnan synthesis protein F